MTWDEWAARSDTTKVFLVETTAVRLADGLTVQLYLSNIPYQSAGKQFIPAVSGLPRLTRQANDTLSPNHIPTWGELEIALEPDLRPDSEATAAWTELLSEAWNLRGQPLTIKLGDPSFAYGAFRTVFTGRVGSYKWTDAKLTLTLYDKAQDFTWKLPDYELPESLLVIEESWNQLVPAVLGEVWNYQPVLFTTSAPGSFMNKHALACHVIQELVGVRGDNNAWPAEFIQFNQKDVFPARQDGEGSAVMATAGPYTGALYRAEWLIEIDSITAVNELGESGPRIGLATFRWSMDKGLTWLGSGLLSWKLAVDDTTLVKLVSLGHGTLTLGGAYTGQIKGPAKIKISTTGYVGTAKFRFSRDNGVTWSAAEIAIPNTAAILFDHGLTAAFTGAAGSLGVTTKIPAAASPGTAAFSGAYDAASYRQYRAVILSGGDVGAATFKWSDDGGATWHGPFTTGLAMALSHGVAISFYGITPEPDPPINDFDAGDEFRMQVPALVAEDCWSWDFKEVPVPLADGVTVQFSNGLDPTTRISGAVTANKVKKESVYSEGVLTPNGAACGVQVDYRIIITNGGATGAAIFSWSDDGGVTTQSNVVTSASPITLSHGVTVTFGNSFNTGDQFGFTVNGPDLALWDEYRFILGSTLGLSNEGAGATITVDAKGLISPALDAYTDKIGELIRAVLMLWRNWTDADFDLDALADFNAAAPYPAGLVVDAATDIAALIDQLLTGIPALYTINQAGQFYLTALAAVTTAPADALELADAELLDLPEVADGSDNLYRRIYLHYDRNYNAEKSPKGTATLEFTAWLQKEFRQVSARDETVLENYPWATDLGPLDTCLAQRLDAQAVAAGNLALYKVKHPTFQIKTKIQPFQFDLWDKIWLRHPRFGVGRRAFAITGIELDFTAAEAALTLWK